MVNILTFLAIIGLFLGIGIIVIITIFDLIISLVTSGKDIKEKIIDFSLFVTLISASILAIIISLP